MTRFHNGAADDGLLQQPRIAHGWQDICAGRIHDEFVEACEFHDMLGEHVGRDLAGHIFTAVEYLSHGECRWLEAHEWDQIAHSLSNVFSMTRHVNAVFANLANELVERADAARRAAL